MIAHPVMQQALSPFSPKKSVVPSLHKMLDERDNAWNGLLRLPFEVEVMTRAANRNGPAEYGDVYAPEELVIEAVDALIDKYIVELEADVKRRMELRDV